MWSSRLQAAKIPPHAAKTREEEAKSLKYFQAYKAQNNTYFEPLL